MYKTTSFTEKAFLNPYYFHYLNPSECEEMRIENPSASVMDTLDSLESNPFISESKGFGHQAMKPVRVVARMVYTVFVSVIIAPLGVVYHGSLALKNLASYSFKRMFTNSQTYAENLEKTKRHGTCLYTDLYATIQGTAIAICCICLPIFFKYLAMGPTPAGKLSFAGTILAATSPYTLGGLNPQTFIPHFIADPDKRIGMYISLKLRNDLGLVGPDGNILPFNSTDNVRFTKTPERALINNDNAEPSNTVLKLAEFIVYSELELINQVRKTNQLAAKHNLETIPFQYPFDGNQIAKKLQDQFKNIQISIEEQKIINDLKIIERKIQVLRTIFIEVTEQAKSSAGEKNYTTNLNPSCLEEDKYEKYFVEGFEEAIAENGNNWSTFLKDLNQINPINPADVAFDPTASTYDKFKYKVGVAKYQALQQKETPLHELLFLKEIYTKEELDKQYRHISLRVHPDKNENSDESHGLFLVLGTAKGKLEEKLGR